MVDKEYVAEVLLVVSTSSLLNKARCTVSYDNLTMAT